MSRLSKSLRTATEKDGAVVLDVTQGRLFRLNPVASRILSHLKDGRTITEIIDRISQEFGAEREQVSADLGPFLEVLRDNDLLENDPRRNS